MGDGLIYQRDINKSLGRDQIHVGPSGTYTGFFHFVSSTGLDWVWLVEEYITAYSARLTASGLDYLRSTGKERFGSQFWTRTNVQPVIKQTKQQSARPASANLIIAHQILMNIFLSVNDKLI